MTVETPLRVSDPSSSTQPTPYMIVRCPSRRIPTWIKPRRQHSSATWTWVPLRPSTHPQLYLTVTTSPTTVTTASLLIMVRVSIHMPLSDPSQCQVLRKPHRLYVRQAHKVLLDLQDANRPKRVPLLPKVLSESLRRHLKVVEVTRRGLVRGRVH